MLRDYTIFTSEASTTECYGTTLSLRAKRVPLSVTGLHYLYERSEYIGVLRDHPIERAKRVWCTSVASTIHMEVRERKASIYLSLRAKRVPQSVTGPSYRTSKASLVYEQSEYHRIL